MSKRKKNNLSFIIGQGQNFGVVNIDYKIKAIHEIMRSLTTLEPFFNYYKIHSSLPNSYVLALYFKGSTTEFIQLIFFESHTPIPILEEKILEEVITAIALRPRTKDEIDKYAIK